MQQDLKFRLQNIVQLLLEIAAGNFCFAVPAEGQDAELDAVIDLVNLAADELRASLFRRGRILQYKSYQYLAQSTFLLDRDHRINGFTKECKFLPSTLSSVTDLPFYSLLEAHSVPQWEQACDALRKNNDFYFSVQLYFSHNKPSQPCYCTISRLLHSDNILVSVIALVYDRASRPNYMLFRQGSVVTPEEEAGLRLHDYILANLHAPLPPIKDLAIKFGTNQFYLKKTFRKLYQTSIFQFYNEQRLKRTHFLIQQTNLPLYEIADSCGFLQYQNFSRAFSKRFGYPARTLRENR